MHQLYRTLLRFYRSYQGHMFDVACQSDESKFSVVLGSRETAMLMLAKYLVEGSTSSMMEKEREMNQPQVLLSLGGTESTSSRAKYSKENGVLWGCSWRCVVVGI